MKSIIKLRNETKGTKILHLLNCGRDGIIQALFSLWYIHTILNLAPHFCQKTVAHIGGYTEFYP